MKLSSTTIQSDNREYESLVDLCGEALANLASDFLPLLKKPLVVGIVEGLGILIPANAPNRRPPRGHLGKLSCDDRWSRDNQTMGHE